MIGSGETVLLSDYVLAPNVLLVSLLPWDDKLLSTMSFHHDIFALEQAIHVQTETVSQNRSLLQIVGAGFLFSNGNMTNIETWCQISQIIGMTVPDHMV